MIGNEKDNVVAPDNDVSDDDSLDDASTETVVLSDDDADLAQRVAKALLASRDEGVAVNAGQNAEQ